MGAFESRMWAVVSVAVSFLATAYFFSVIWALGGLLVLLLLVLRSLARSTLVWDLDQTLLVSQSQGDAAPELCETIQAIDGFVMRHVDDDAIAFVTLFRPWARGVLRTLHRLGTRQYVFTAASRGYASNCLIGLLGDDRHRIISEVLSATEHPNQRYRGKDLRLFSRPPVDLARTVLVTTGRAPFGRSRATACVSGNS